MAQGLQQQNQEQLQIQLQKRQQQEKMHQQMLMQSHVARLQMLQGMQGTAYRDHLLHAQMSGGHPGAMGAHMAAQHASMVGGPVRSTSHLSESGSARKMNVSSNVVTGGQNNNNEQNQNSNQRTESNSQSFSQISKHGSKNETMQGQNSESQQIATNSSTNTANQLPELNLPKQINMLHEEWYNPNFGEITEYNVLDYFCHHTNPFYETSNLCFNEMRRKVNKEALANMFGYEYQLTFCQPPIMFIISKIERAGEISNENVNNKPKTLASYHIIAGRVRKAPDLGSLITCRLKASVHHLREAFDKITEKSRYHPAVGYWWDHDKVKDKKIELNKEDDYLLRNNFQTENTDFLLRELHMDLATGAYGNLKKEEIKEVKIKQETNGIIDIVEEDSLPSDAKRRKILEQ